MKLSELEKAINIRFPEKWYEIYHTGAMEWLELSHGDFNKRRDDYLNNPNAFLCWVAIASRCFSMISPSGLRSWTK